MTIKAKNDLVMRIGKEICPPLIIDECPDAQGYSTLRFDDGTSNGDISDPPVATIYRQEFGGILAATPDLYEALWAFVDLMEQEWDDKRTGFKDAYERGLLALKKANR
jgi:hypothetical protein